MVTVGARAASTRETHTHTGRTQMIAGETILSGAADTCGSCNIKLVLQPLRSGAGWYLGTACYCGPYSRESIYFETEEEAKKAISSGEPENWMRF